METAILKFSSLVNYLIVNPFASYFLIFFVCNNQGNVPLRGIGNLSKFFFSGNIKTSG